MTWSINIHDEVADWFLALCAHDPHSADSVEQAIELLADIGPSLGRPMADVIHGSSMKNLKELRPGSGGRTEIRILFVFDPDRECILLVAGDKAGNWRRWHDTAVPLAEERYRQYLDHKEKAAE
ncbi:type II toxin-antitoxin system RelE/ParE family toxin [Streptomyces sp. NPDC059474]|uniref:type II toxin-antitoxin system RelE/ParE family toxin n=1 Tax=Streptomyces sp. NPDC059474 TaxID=3346846 RepID=UPI0036CA999C